MSTKNRLMGTIFRNHQSTRIIHLADGSTTGGTSKLVVEIPRNSFSFISLAKYLSLVQIFYICLCNQAIHCFVQFLSLQLEQWCVPLPPERLPLIYRSAAAICMTLSTSDYLFGAVVKAFNSGTFIKSPDDYSYVRQLSFSTNALQIKLLWTRSP